MKIPSDLHKERIKYEAKGGGTCGPSILALLFGHSVEYIITHWDKEYNGYATFGEMKNELALFSLAQVKRIGAKKSKKFKLPVGYWMAIARIQWEGDWGHWAEAQKHTHYVLIQAWDAGSRIFCNSRGWFHYSEDKNYLKNGHITSFLVIDDWKMVEPK